MILVLCDRIGTSLVKYDLGPGAFSASGLDLFNIADLRIDIPSFMIVTSFYVTNEQGKVLWEGDFSRDLHVGRGDGISIQQGKLRLFADQTEPLSDLEATVS